MPWTERRQRKHRFRVSDLLDNPDNWPGSVRFRGRGRTDDGWRWGGQRIPPVFSTMSAGRPSTGLLHRLCWGNKHRTRLVPMLGLSTSERALERGLNMSSEKGPTSTGMEGQEAQACHHYWLIEPARGSLSRGVCQVCQEVREFKNSIEWQYGQRKPGRPAASSRPGAPAE